MCMLCIYVFLGACPAPNAGLGCVHLAKRQAMYITQRPCAAQAKKKKKKNPIQSPTTPPPCNYYLLHVESPSCPPTTPFLGEIVGGGRHLSPARSIDVEASWFMIPPPSHKLFVRPLPPSPFFCSGWFVISSVPYFSVSVKLGRLPGSVWARTFVDDDFLFFLCVFCFFCC
jgi:hypothetical protein